MRKINNIIKLHLLFFVFSLTGIFSKYASQSEFLSTSYLTNMFFVLVIFMAYAFFWQSVLAEMPVSTAYAQRSILIIWGLVWGTFIFTETINLKMIIGGILILFGLYWIGKK